MRRCWKILSVLPRHLSPFYEDLQDVPLPQSPNTWICGDLHLENFGSYKANNKLVYFDLNDF